VTRAVILDLGNVIVGLDFPRAYRAAASLTGHSAGEIPELIRAANLARPYERGELTSEEFYLRFCRALDLKISYSEFVDLWSDMFQPEPILTDGLLRELAATTKLLMLSNTNEIHFEFIRGRYPLVRHFHDFVLSYRVGAMKPDAAIYLDAVRRAGCEPGECFFVDDIEENIAAARQLGIDAEIFRSANELEAQLRQRGVLPAR
jgi:putative hydrolase of the HAD superfamily